MGTDIGYLQTKIKQNKEKIEEMERIINSSNSLIEIKSKKIDEEINNLKKIKDEIKNINLLDLKEHIINSVVGDINNILESKIKKELNKNKEIMSKWFIEIQEETQKNKIENSDDLFSDLNFICKTLFKILESNNIKVDEKHIEAIEFLTLNNKEATKFNKKLKKTKEISQEGFQNLRKHLPGKNFEKMKEKFNEEKKIEIKKLDKIDPLIYKNEQTK